MLEKLTCACEARGCDRELGDSQLILTMEADGCERRAYECACGAVTITVVK